MSRFAIVQFESEAIAQSVISRRQGTLFESTKPIVFHRSSAAEFLAMLFPVRSARWAGGHAASLSDELPPEFKELARACLSPIASVTMDRVFAAFSDLIEFVRRAARGATERRSFRGPISASGPSCPAFRSVTWRRVRATALIRLTHAGVVQSLCWRALHERDIHDPAATIGRLVRRLDNSSG